MSIKDGGFSFPRVPLSLSLALWRCSFPSFLFFPLYLSNPPTTAATPPPTTPPHTAGVSIWQWGSALPAILAESSFSAALNHYLHLLDKHVTLTERKKGGEGDTEWHMFKGIVHPKSKFHLFYTHPDVHFLISNLRSHSWVSRKERIPPNWSL